jgi:DNA-binding MarR family transcriptional regulator
MRERLQPQSLTRALRVLEGRKFIARIVDDADRRRSTITITPSGIEVLRRYALGRESWLSRAIASTLSAAERDVLRIAAALMEQLADAEE